jgi:hypothetical protein
MSEQNFSPGAVILPNRRNHGIGVSSLVVNTAPCVMCQIGVHNTSANARFLLFHDAISLPAEETVPLWSVPLPASSAFVLDFYLPCYVGLVVAVSETSDELTISTDDINVVVTYRE